MVVKLRKKQYDSLQGFQLDKLWSAVRLQTDPKEVKTVVEFLNSKEEEIISISETFEIINDM